MRLQPLIPGTLALWQFQNDTLDYSGNGLTLSPVNVSTNAPTSAPGFIPMSSSNNGVVTNDPCIVGVNLDAGGRQVKLEAPLSSILQVTGPMTVEWLMAQKFTFQLTYFACAVPTGRSGGAGPDRIGSLYTMWSDSGNPLVSDQHIGSNLPSAGYDAFPGYNDHTLHNWADNGQPIPGDWHTHHFAYVRDGSGHWQVYRDGVTAGAGITSAGTNVAAGTERFFVGSFEAGAGGATGLLASVRMLNYARAQADIAADAAAALGSCTAALSYRGVNIRLDTHK